VPDKIKINDPKEEQPDEEIRSSVPTAQE
jgi:hypothetical protein